MKILMIFAHPDDDTFSCAGKILHLTSAGNEVKIICGTNGDEGETGTPPICSKEELGIIREKEEREAAKILGISEVYFLGFKDGDLNKIPSTEIENKILKIIEKEIPDEIYTFGPDGSTNHPDHISISFVATNAFNEYSKNHTCSLFYVVNPRSNVEKLRGTNSEYKSFGKILGSDTKNLIKVDISNEFDAKVKALMCHKTQNKDFERFITSGNLIDLHFEYFKKYN